MGLSLLVNLTWGSSSHDRLDYYPVNIYYSLLPLCSRDTPYIEVGLSHVTHF